MTDVGFYILGGQTQQDQWQFACRLAEKAARQGNQLLIQLDNELNAKAFSDMLWSFRPDAFVPHALLNDPQAPENCQVSIGWNSHDGGHQHDVLINLSQNLPDFFGRFHRLIEIVVQQDDVLNYTRKHYKHLQDRGYPITHTDMRMR